MRLVIADDEPLALDLLDQCLAGRDDVDVVGRARSGDEAAAMLMSLRPDLAILDIAMPKLNGLDVARLVAQTEHTPMFAFLTAYSDFAVRAFELDAIDYVLKPFTPERIGETVQRASRRLSMGPAAEEVRLSTGEPPIQQPGFQRELWAPTRVGVRRVPVSDIIWIEAARDYVLLHTEVRTEIIRMRMSELETRLDPADLLRVHRSYFVRPDAVVEMAQLSRSHLQLVLSTGARVEVGRTYADRARLALTMNSLRPRRALRLG